MVKKITVLLILLISLLLNKSFTTSAFAATIYSNPLTSSLTGYQEFFNHCTTSANGLICSGPTSEQYSSVFPKEICVSADFVDPKSQSDSLSLTDGAVFNQNAATIRANYNGYVAIDTAKTYEGVAVSSKQTPSGQHNYMLCKDGDIFEGYLDNNLVISYTESGHNPTSFLIGSSGGNVLIKNLIVTDSLPTPTPTPTPSPTPLLLNVPLIKQTSSPWGSQIYDSANKWAPTSPTISSWGCAITDVAMIFQYFGITKMPDGSALNPTTINKWLKSQPDGYIGNGLVNWWALQRLSMLAKLAFNNPNFAADALEYKRNIGADTSLLTTNLQNKIPSILDEVGHFVVATGAQGNTFTINDPYFTRLILSTAYNNTFASSGVYTPSHTDLSYILFVGPQNVDFSLKNSSGSAVGEEFIEQPLENPTNPSQKSGDPVKIFNLQQPGNDTYTLTVTSPNNSYKAKAYAYDTKGNARIFDLTGSGTVSNPDIFTLSFSKTNNSQDTIKKSTIFDTLLHDISSLYQGNQINKNTYKDLSDEVEEAQEQYSKKHFLQEKIRLGELLIKLIIQNDSHHISDKAYQTLVADITYLLTH